MVGGLVCVCVYKDFSFGAPVSYKFGTILQLNISGGEGVNGKSLELLED